MLLRKTLSAIFLSFIFLSTALSTTYYVDASYGSDSKSGTSVSNAWRTIAKVNAVILRPGDQVLFKRGNIWKETLTVKYSGTSSAPITFGAYSSGNLPVIDAANTRVNCIYIINKSYIVVKDLRMINTVGVGGSGCVRIKYSQNITVNNCDFYVTGRASVLLEESSYCKVLNNTVKTPSTFLAVQTDGIYGQRNSYNTYDGNNVVISNRHTDMHCDGIQLFEEKNATVCNNYFEQNNTKTGNAQGIYAEKPSGTFRIFNNVCYGMYTTSSLIKFKNYSTYGTAQIIGNSVYGGKGQLVVTNDPNVIFKNNIVQTTAGDAPVRFESSIGTKSNVNNNLYKRGNSGAVIIYAGSSSSNYKTLSQWKSLGFDLKSIEANPLFVNPSGRNFSLQSSSPALNKGVVLSSPFNVDMLGKTRPYGSSSEMGAYEITGTSKIDGDGPEDKIVSPDKFELSQNFPNPFNPSTRIKFSLPSDQEISLKVYDILGNEIASLVSGNLTAGSYEYDFNGSELASGTYVYVLRTKNYVESKKMMLIK